MKAILCKGWAVAVSVAAGLLITTSSPRAAEAAARITVQANRPGHAISPLLWGIFFEDINHSADGGLVPELVRNRSFEDAEKAEHWTLIPEGATQSEVAIDQSRPLNPFNRRSLCWRMASVENGKARLINEGYWGMGLVQGETYRLSLAARGADRFNGRLEVRLEKQSGEPLAQGTIEGIGADWKTFTLDLKPAGTDPKARLVLSVNHQGTLWLDMVSLYPQRTWKDRPQGLRPDLAEMLAGLNPAFVRFPGGCWVEGHDLAHSYRWKETVGEVAQRRPLYNLWQYHATHALGFLEYLLLCEDLGAEPLFVINCGMSHSENVPMDQMGPIVQDALDAIEYANGATNTVWGGMRARHGHPAPFGLKYLEIGNENGGPAYHQRYALMYRAIKERYPAIHLIANEWGGIPKNCPVEIVDEHYYSTPEFFLQQANRYDRYDRKGPKVYVGEYAVTQGGGQGNLRAAVGEAAFMIGMERNSDVVALSSYAPLFVNVNYRKWNPDLINFDSARVYGLPSYYAQRMFSANRGDVVLPVTMQLPPPPPGAVRHGRIGLGTWRTQAEYKDVRVTQGNEVLFTSDFQAGAGAWQPRRGEWSAQNGAYRQTSEAEDLRAQAGDAAWTDYTYSVKARKLGGAEGFLIMFHVRDDQNWVWWNLGGWNNREHAIERCEEGGKGGLGQHVPGQIELGRWYDIRIELKGQNVKCFLDGALIHDVDYPRAEVLYASASRVKQSGDVILKVVNAAKEALAVDLELKGLPKRRATAEAWVLTSAKPTDENSLEEPTKVAPVRHDFEVENGKFRHPFPGNSVTVLRFKAKK